MKSRSKFLVSTVLIVFLVACAPLEQVSETSSTPQTEPVTNTNTPEPTSSFTPEPSPTQTQTQAPTPTPTQTSTISPTPMLIDFDGSVINSSNFINLENYATLGKGKIESIDVSEDGKYHIIKTALGIFLYDTETLEELGFFEDYGFYSQIPGKNQIIAATPALTLAVIDFLMFP